MHIYVVIPVFNRKEYTRSCLASLESQDARGFTIIVVDDGSTDGTSAMIEDEFPDTILLHGDGNLWWVGSINKGIRQALELCQAEDYIIVINNDLVVPSEYVSSFIDAARRCPNAIIGSVETTIPQPDTIKSGGVLVNWKTAKRRVLNQGRQLKEFPTDLLVSVDRLTGRGTLFPSQVFRDVGLYDEVHFKQCGDTDLPVRANFKHGYELLVSYGAVVNSQVENSNSINNKQRYSISDAKEYFWGIRSHFNLRDKYWIAHNIAPNKAWFLRYFTLNSGRIIGRYVIRLRF